MAQTCMVYSDLLVFELKKIRMDGWNTYQCSCCKLQVDMLLGTQLTPINKFYSTSDYFLKIKIMSIEGNTPYGIH